MSDPSDITCRLYDLRPDRPEEIERKRVNGALCDAARTLYGGVPLAAECHKFVR